jgi:acetyltransferase-like isoleucine patch superfamily enzyme
MNIKGITLIAIFKKVFRFIYTFIRILKYKILSNSNNIVGFPILISPLLTNGKGNIFFGKNVVIGVNTSPFFYETYSYIEARNVNSFIRIGDNVAINNNATIVSEGEGIIIGNDTLIGTNVFIADSDFHNLDPNMRLSNLIKTEKVIIGNNVFIGSNVSILKGVTVGDNSVIAYGSVVTKSVPSNVIAGGTPCRVIKKLEINN